MTVGGVVNMAQKAFHPRRMWLEIVAIRVYVDIRAESSRIVENPGFAWTHIQT
jgi:hypothetical protein